MRVDLHVHCLPASSDSRMGLEAMAAAAGAAGVDAIALTDHGPGGDFGAAERALAAAGVALVPGREVSCALGHVLVLSTDADWLVALPPRASLPLGAAARGPVALVWAHPAGWRTGGFAVPPDPSRGAEHIDAVEVLNGERLWQAGGVDAARELAGRLEAAATGGSDAHDAQAVGRCLTEAPNARDPVSFVEALAAGEVRPVLSAAWAAENDTMYIRADLVSYLG